MKKTPRPKPFGARDIAELVDLRVRAGIPLTEARRDVAESFGMEFAAVERDHQRHGIQKRGKSR